MYLQTVQKKTENADLLKNCLIYSQQVGREKKQPLIMQFSDLIT